MYERLVENWLISANELTYQVPFCEVLVAEGYTILHMSRHGRGEHGKDVVARRSDGLLCTFQLKGGDIALSALRDIRGEIEELVQLPVRLPGISEDEPHIPHLVTNGELRGDAPENLTRYSDEWMKKGHPKLEVWEKGLLLDKFLKAQGAYLPTTVREFRQFVDLYAGPFDGPFPREKFDEFFAPMIDTACSNLGETQLRRALAGSVLIAGYIVEQYARAENHLAATIGWTMTVSSVFRVAETSQSSIEVYEPVLQIARSGFDRSLEAFAAEVLSSQNFVSGRFVVVDPVVHGIRATEILGWLAAWIVRKQEVEEDADSAKVLEVFQREFSGAEWVTEADWPAHLAMALFFDREGRAGDCNALLASWVRSLISSAVLASRADSGVDGAPSPYWLAEEVTRFRNGLMAPADEEFFGNSTFTARQALDMLVKRDKRALVSALWPDATRTIFSDFVPSEPREYFTWRTQHGVLNQVMPQRTRSWAEWRAETSAPPVAGVPTTLARQPEWLLPFLLTYPHRANRTLTAFADTAFGEKKTLA